MGTTSQGTGKQHSIGTVHTCPTSDSRTSGQNRKGTRTSGSSHEKPACPRPVQRRGVRRAISVTCSPRSLLAYNVHCVLEPTLACWKTRRTPDMPGSCLVAGPAAHGRPLASESSVEDARFLL